MFPSIFDEFIRIVYRTEKNEPGEYERGRVHFGYALRFFSRKLDNDGGKTELEKACALYEYALSLQNQYKNPENRAAIVSMCREMKAALVAYSEQDKRPSAHGVDYPHGHTRNAYQVKNDERGPWSGYWSEHRISKCWKDQRGKGRNKRNHQYRCVAAL